MKYMLMFYWVAMAHLQRACGHASAARSALSRAIGLTADARVRAYLATQGGAGAAAA